MDYIDKIILKTGESVDYVDDLSKVGTVRTSTLGVVTEATLGNGGTFYFVVTDFMLAFYSLTGRADLLSHNGKSIEFYIKNNMYRILGNRIYIDDVGSCVVDDMKSLYKLLGDVHAIR